MDGLVLVVLIGAGIAAWLAYHIGWLNGQRAAAGRAAHEHDAAEDTGRPAIGDGVPAPPGAPPNAGPDAAPDAAPGTDDTEAALRSLRARALHLAALAEDRHALWRELAQARSDTARYRAVVVGLENDAPPPLLNAQAMPDDLKLIVGIGPALERLLQQLGVASYRQIARWSEREIDAIDAELPEFRGRIRRDAWVTQARELHARKYGVKP